MVILRLLPFHIPRSRLPPDTVCVCQLKGRKAYGQERAINTPHKPGNAVVNNSVRKTRHKAESVSEHYYE